MDPFETSKPESSAYLPPEQYNLQRVARIATFYHLALIPVAATRIGDWLVSGIDILGKAVGLSAINTGVNDYWRVPVIGLVVLLAFCCWRVWRNPGKTEWMQPVVLVHGLLAASYFVYFYLDIKSLAYLLTMILELVLFGVLGYFWWAAKSPSQPASPSGGPEQGQQS
ncbi:MAG: hypothetical protein C4523_07870 [Myxococcales bacterium]|nr:MAG: hypothetical protein C4523_07870 [Myxococcales bacterium]